MRIARGLLTEVPGVSFTTDSVTRERLILDLTQSQIDGHSSMTAFSSEFASLLASSGLDMINFLTDVYDCPSAWSHKTKAGGTNKINAPYLNLISCTTPESLSEAMPLQSVGIGFTSRVVFIYEDVPRRRPPFPKLSPEQVELKQLLVHDLVAMSQLAGEYHFTDDAKASYEQWYVERIEHPNPTGDPRLNGYFARKSMHVIKIAMVVAASMRDELLITQDDLTTALQLLGNIETNIPRVFSSIGKNPLAADYDEVFGAIKSGRAENLPKLIRQFKHSLRKEELLEVIETLVAEGRVMPADRQQYFAIANEEKSNETDHSSTGGRTDSEDVRDGLLRSDE
jgi:hypothetical protein